MSAKSIFYISLYGLLLFSCRTKPGGGRLRLGAAGGINPMQSSASRRSSDFLIENPAASRVADPPPFEQKWIGEASINGVKLKNQEEATFFMNELEDEKRGVSILVLHNPSMRPLLATLPSDLVLTIQLYKEGDPKPIYTAKCTLAEIRSNSQGGSSRGFGRGLYATLKLPMGNYIFLILNDNHKPIKINKIKILSKEAEYIKQGGCLWLGEQWLKLGRMDKAIEVYEKIALTEDNAYQLAKAWCKLEKWDKAIEVYKKSGQIWYIAEAYLQKQDYVQAVNYYRQHVSWDDKREEAYQKLIELYLSSDQSELVNELYQELAAHFIRENKEDFVQLYCEKGQCWDVAVEFYFNKNNLDQAVAYCHKIPWEQGRAEWYLEVAKRFEYILLDPAKAQQIYKTLAVHYIEVGDSEKAIDFYSQAGCYSEALGCYMASSNWEKAMILLLRHPDSCSDPSQQATVYQSLMTQLESGKVLDNPNDMERIYSALIEYYEDKGELDKLKFLYENYKGYKSWENLGKQYEQAGNYPQAIACYQKGNTDGWRKPEIKRATLTMHLANKQFGELEKSCTELDVELFDLYCNFVIPSGCHEEIIQWYKQNGNQERYKKLCAAVGTFYSAQDCEKAAHFFKESGDMSRWERELEQVVKEHQQKGDLEKIKQCYLRLAIPYQDDPSGVKTAGYYFLAGAWDKAIEVITDDKLKQDWCKKIADELEKQGDATNRKRYQLAWAEYCIKGLLYTRDSNIAHYKEAEDLFIHYGETESLLAMYRSSNRNDLLGRLYKALHQYDEAIKAYEALHQYNKAIEIYEQVGGEEEKIIQLYLKQKKWKEAVKKLRLCCDYGHYSILFHCTKLLKKIQLLNCMLIAIHEEEPAVAKELLSESIEDIFIQLNLLSQGTIEPLFSVSSLQDTETDTDTDTEKKKTTDKTHTKPKKERSEKQLMERLKARKKERAAYFVESLFLCLISVVELYPYFSAAGGVNQVLSTSGEVSQWLTTLQERLNELYVYINTEQAPYFKKCETSYDDFFKSRDWNCLTRLNWDNLSSCYDALLTLKLTFYILRWGKGPVPDSTKLALDQLDYLKIN